MRIWRGEEWGSGYHCPSEISLWSPLDPVDQGPSKLH